MTSEYFYAEVSTDDAKVLIISVAARMAGMHPQTLRQYDRMGLVQPGRAAGGGRRYSARDVALLREIQRLSQDDGVNLAGVKRDHRAGAAHLRAAAAPGRGRGGAGRAAAADRPGRGDGATRAGTCVPTRTHADRARRLAAAPFPPIMSSRS